MTLDVDEDILQDFLIEAGEILEQLSEQLVELEKQPDDKDLLNAIFRGFHTVKGGSGFLGLTPLVDVCHCAENLFDLLRNGECEATPELMDTILRSLDTVNDMFATVQGMEMPEPADPDLLEELHRLSSGGAAAPAAEEAAPEPDPEPEKSGGGDSGIDEITEDEFEALLDELHGPTGGDEKAAPKPAAPAAAKSSDEITEEEFDALLDELQNKMGENNPLKQVQTEVDDMIGADGKKAEQPAPAKAAPKPKAAPKKEEPKKEEKAPAKQAPVADTTLRVDTRTLDDIMNMVGELVLVRNRLVSIGVSTSDAELSKAIGTLDVVTGNLQGGVMKTRMQPIKKVFGRFPRVVRDLARSLKKEIELEMIGEETDLDKNLVEALADPMVHLVRNSCDHGIEMPDEREANGKPRQGKIVLSAEQHGDHILLVIDDDGAGMDPDKLKSIAMDRGVIDQELANRMSDKEAFNLIFAPGFSTKTEISDISGRGVGMDVVKTSIIQLNGSIEIDSKRGEGTRLEIKVPLTLAILPTLMIIVDEQTFALPLTSVSEIWKMDLGNTYNVEGQKTIIIRGKSLPLFYMDDWLGRHLRGKHHSKNRAERSKQAQVVVVQMGSQLVAFVVDGLIGQEEVVIKPLDGLLQGTPGMSGATITSDGGIALILDVPSLLDAYAKKSNEFLAAMKEKVK